tara:strand:- start:540 stop:1406 length:867 start_codon:yes stop_codon:yes gene_type:complete
MSAKLVIGNVDLFPFNGDAAVTGNLEVSGVLNLSEVTSVPAAPASGTVKMFMSGNQMFAKFPDSTVINMSSSGPNVSNASDNRIVTCVDSDTFNGEANLTFDGTDLELTGALNVSGNIIVSNDVTTGSEAGPGSFLALDANNRVILTEGGGGAVTIANDANNRITTAGGDGSINGEANLTFDGNTLVISAGLVLKRRSVTSTTTASATDYYLAIRAGGDIDVRLPDASTLTEGQTFVLKDELGTSQAHNVAISASGDQTIDGNNFILLNSPFAAIHLYTNGSNGYFIY